MTHRERSAFRRPLDYGALRAPALGANGGPVHHHPPRGAVRARGNMLVVAMILLAVLSVLGVSAVTLSSEERRNAAAQARHDALEACARAAQARIWAEVAKYGPTYLKSGTPVLAPESLPGGMTVRAPAHYSASATNPTPDDGSTIQVSSVVVQFDQGVSDGSLAKASDLTNRAVAIDQLGSGKAYRIVARCQDSRGRELEAEFSMRFTLF